MIAALFVDVWDVTRDARKYAGPHAVVGHPPCERWGRYATGGPNPRARRRLVGDDDGCFAAALEAVRRYGGVLEHPEASAAWAHFGVPRPPKCGGWIGAPGLIGNVRAWTCCVEQGHYGHRARKATWLYAVLPIDQTPPQLKWGPSQGERLDEGFHSAEERRAARAAGRTPRRRLSRAENIATPPAFAEVLLGLARMTPLLTTRLTLDVPRRSLTGGLG